jgi:hypothetical protein
VGEEVTDMTPYVGPTAQEQLAALKQRMQPGTPIDPSAMFRGIVGVLEAMLSPTILCGECPGEHFESTEDVRAHIVREHRGLADRTTRELLNELRTRAENWGSVRRSGAGWLADRIDDAYVTLEGGGMIDGKREP